MSGPLDGVRILDLSRLFPGPYASLLLADLGADVVKVESPVGGDYIRAFPPLLASAGGAAFWALNRGKRSVAFDLTQPEQRQEFLKLVRYADVVIESFRPGVMEKLNVGPAILHQENARLIVCRISGYGQDGPDAKRAGHDINYAARAGVLGTMAKPVALPVQVADLAGGAWPAALQICAALVGQRNRKVGDAGVVIDVSMTDGAHAMLIMPLARQAVDPHLDVDGGSDLLVGSVPSYDVYPTKSGHLAIGALEPKFWQGLCGVLDLNELASEGWTTGPKGDDVRAQLKAKLAHKTAQQWHEIFAEHDVCVEVIRAPSTAIEDEHLRERRLRVPVVVDGKEMSFPATPISMTGAQPATAPAPELGADGDEVKREWKPREFE